MAQIFDMFSGLLLKSYCSFVMILFVCLRLFMLTAFSSSCMLYSSVAILWLAWFFYTTFLYSFTLQIILAKFWLWSSILMFRITSSQISIMSEIIFSHSCSIVSTSPPISSSISLNTSVLHSNVNILLTSSNLQFLEKQGSTKYGSNSLIFDSLSPFSSKNCLRIPILEGLSSFQSMQYQMQTQHSSMLILVLTLYCSMSFALFFLMACKIISKYYLTSPLQLLPPFRKIFVTQESTQVMGLTCFIALDSLIKTDRVLVILRALRKETIEAQSRLDYDIFWQFLMCRD